MTPKCGQQRGEAPQQDARASTMTRLTMATLSRLSRVQAICHGVRPLIADRTVAWPTGRRWCVGSLPELTRSQRHGLAHLSSTSRWQLDRAGLRAGGRQQHVAESVNGETLGHMSPNAPGPQEAAVARIVTARDEPSHRASACRRPADQGSTGASRRRQRGGRRRSGHAAAGPPSWPGRRVRSVVLRTTLRMPDRVGGHLDALVLAAELQRLLEAAPGAGARAARGSSARRTRMLVSFFSLVELTSMSSAREFSPTIMPS